jgi:hypothetical protein
MGKSEGAKEGITPGQNQKVGKLEEVHELEGGKG